MDDKESNNLRLQEESSSNGTNSRASSRRRYTPTSTPCKDDYPSVSNRKEDTSSDGDITIRNQTDIK